MNTALQYSAVSNRRFRYGISEHLRRKYASIASSADLIDCMCSSGMTRPTLVLSLSGMCQLHPHPPVEAMKVVGGTSVSLSNG
jgi:hypothetical protein